MNASGWLNRMGWIVVVGMAGIGAIPAWADPTTNIISATVSNCNGICYVGENGPDSGSYLEINSGGQLIDTSAIIGNYGSYDQGLVTGANSVWTNSGNIYVGNLRGYNQVAVENGARLYAQVTYIGNDTAVNFNTGVVSGANARWINLDNGNTYFGFGGSFNTVRIEDGGYFEDGACIVGNGGRSNSVTVTGSGAVWTNRSTAVIGYYGWFNSLVVTNGGHANAAGWYIGHDAVSVSNTVTVTGSGSVLRSEGVLYVGSYGSYNEFRIEDGGRVETVGASSIGDWTADTGNKMFVVGNNSVWSNAAAVTVGNWGPGNTLTISNGGCVYDGNAILGYQITAPSNNLILVTGAGSVMTNTGIMYVGLQAAGNQLRIEAGAQVFNGTAYVGQYGTAPSNTAIVSGPNSRWNCSGDLALAYSGAPVGNGLIISNGGAVTVSGNVTIPAGNYLSNTVAGIAGGLDMTATSDSALSLGGTMTITFAANPIHDGPFWGLRWVGNHVSKLQGYVGANLTLNDSAMDSYWQKQVSIYYDSASDYTYVGFNALLPRGTAIMIQ